MFLFDLHCDTLTEANDRGRGLMNGELALSLDRMPGERWCQCFAIFMPDNLRGQAAVQYFERNLRFFRAQMNLHASVTAPARTTAQMEAVLEAGKTASILTVEGGSALAGEIGRVKELAKAGVRMMTLTWNGTNEIAGGQVSGEGFSFFGRMIVPILEQNDIIVDVSHLSDLAFWELTRFAKRPLVASHSNARAVCPHPRNLTDDQFRHIVQAGGLVGLNFFPKFVSGESDATFDQLCAHVEHFLSLGGAHVLAIGSDFDGASLPSWMTGVEYMPILHGQLSERFGQEQTDLIFGENAMTFLRRYEALGLLLGALREDG